MKSERNFILKKGDMVGKRYKVLNVLGIGGIGVTYRAFDEKLQRYVAMKEFLPLEIAGIERMEVESPTITLEKYEKLKERFLDEARKLAKIKHEGIPEIYDVLEENGTVYMVMELVEGKNLREIMKRNKKLNLSFVLDKFSEICEIVSFMHSKGIIHCDLKPDNIILKEDGKIKIVDFGNAREYISEYTQTQPGFFTPGYAPIELYALKIPKGPFTDVYSLGGILYFMLTGSDPISAPDRIKGIEFVEVRKINPDVPEYIEKAITKAMAIDPTERFKNVTELKEFITSGYKNEEKTADTLTQAEEIKDFDMEEAIFFSGCLKIVILSVVTFLLILLTFRFCARVIFIP